MRWIAPLLAAAVALALLWLGTPRLVASVLRAPSYAALSDAEAGRTRTAPQLARATHHLEAVVRWENSARAHGDLGFLRLLLAVESAPDDPARRAHARRAAAALRAALRRSPAGPHSWVRLAYARALAGSGPAEVTEALEHSVAAGAYVGEVAVARLELLLGNWEALSPRMQRYTTRQIRFVGQNKPDHLIGLAKRTGRADLMGFAVRTIPEASERLRRALPRRED